MGRRKLFSAEKFSRKKINFLSGTLLHMKIKELLDTVMRIEIGELNEKILFI